MVPNSLLNSGYVVVDEAQNESKTRWVLLRKREKSSEAQEMLHEGYMKLRLKLATRLSSGGVGRSALALFPGPRF